MKELFNSFSRSLAQLTKVLKKRKTIEIRDSAIKRFEFTIELAWKTMQRFLREEKIICRSPKESLKEAFKIGLIEDDPAWLEMLEDRNLTVHTYNEAIADEVYKRLPGYLTLLSRLKDSFMQRLED